MLYYTYLVERSHEKINPFPYLIPKPLVIVGIIVDDKPNSSLQNRKADQGIED
jgi:hypothetical protein